MGSNASERLSILVGFPNVLQGGMPQHLFTTAIADNGGHARINRCTFNVLSPLEESIALSIKGGIPLTESS